MQQQTCDRKSVELRTVQSHSDNVITDSHEICDLTE